MWSVYAKWILLLQNFKLSKIKRMRFKDIYFNMKKMKIGQYFYTSKCLQAIPDNLNIQYHKYGTAENVICN